MISPLNDPDIEEGDVLLLLSVNWTRTTSVGWLPTIGGDWEGPARPVVDAGSCHRVSPVIVAEARTNKSSVNATRNVVYHLIDESIQTLSTEKSTVT